MALVAKCDIHSRYSPTMLLVRTFAFLADFPVFLLFLVLFLISRIGLDQLLLDPIQGFGDILMADAK